MIVTMCQCGSIRFCWRDNEERDRLGGKVCICRLWSEIDEREVEISDGVLVIWDEVEVAL